MKLKIGDRVLVKQYGLFSSIFHAHIKSISWGIFGKTYLCTWRVNSLDYGIHYEEIGFLHWWNIINID